MTSANGPFVGFGLPGMETSGQGVAATNADGQTEAVPYKIPPIFWMVIFLVAGYVGVRKLVED